MTTIITYFTRKSKHQTKYQNMTPEQYDALVSMLSPQSGPCCGGKCVEPAPRKPQEEVLTPAEKREIEIATAIEAMDLGSKLAQLEVAEALDEAGKAEADGIFVSNEELEALNTTVDDEVAAHFETIAVCMKAILSYRYGINLPSA